MAQPPAADVTGWARGLIVVAQLRRRFLTVLAGSPLVWLSACSKTPESPLSIAAHVWPGYEPMFLARREGWLDPAQVRLVDTTSATDSLQALAAGTVDGAALTLDEVLRARASGVPLTVVLVFDISAGADVLLARPGINKLADLKGRRVAVEDGAVGALMFAKALQAGGLVSGEVQLVPLTVNQQIDAWREGRVDAAVTYEPVSSQLLEAGAKRLFDSRQIPDLIVDVLAVRSGIVGTRAEAIRHLLAAHFRALGHLRRNPQDAAYRMAQRMNLAPDQVLASFKGLVLPDHENNHRLLSGATPSLLVSARSLSAVMRQAGLLANEDTLTGLLSGDMLPYGEAR